MPTSWYVSAQARALVGWSFPVGAVLIVLCFALIIVVVSNSVSALTQKLQVTDSYATTYNLGSGFSSSVRACKTVTCVN